MGHVTAKSFYDLQKRLEKVPQGAPESEALFKILETLFTEEEADLVSKLPIRPITVKKAAKIWGKSVSGARKILNRLADKGLMMDIRFKNTQTYILAPTMAGFFEFSLMRTDGKFNRKVLSELYYQYINKDERFLHEIFGLNPAIARPLIHEDTIQPKDQSFVLDYERATHAVKTASCVTVGTCYCRHKMEHKGKACDNPQEVCLSLNGVAKSLLRHGIAKEISKKEALEILDDCMKRGLVQIGDNVQENVGWICNCCSCCCEALLAYKRLGYVRLSTNFYADPGEDCTGCNICVKRCPVDAIKMKKDRDGRLKAEVDMKRCIGCGVCSRFCPVKTMTMEKRDERAFVPKDSFERFVLSAIDRGKLQNLIFDDYHLWTNELFRRFLGIMLKLPPAKQLLANRQLRSRFINKAAHIYYMFNKDFFKGSKPDYSHPELKK